MTQRELAKKLGVTVSTVTKWENEGFIPRGSTLIKLSKIFNVTIDSIVKAQERVKAKA